MLTLMAVASAVLSGYPPGIMRRGQRTLQKKLRAVGFERLVSQFAGDDFL